MNRFTHFLAFRGDSSVSNPRHEYASTKQICRHGLIALWLRNSKTFLQGVTTLIYYILPTYDPTRLCSSTAGSSPPRRIAIFVYAVHHVSMLHPSTVPGRLAISYVAFL